MGMDVYGREPVSETGEYYRSNMWWWAPLADYIIDMCADIAVRCEGWHLNDGDGLNADDADKLADLLDAQIVAGTAARYIAQREARLAALPDERCGHCDGGRREPKARNEQGRCNHCNGTHEVLHMSRWYQLDLATLREFAQFSRDSGGFEIW